MSVNYMISYNGNPKLKMWLMVFNHENFWTDDFRNAYVWKRREDAYKQLLTINPEIFGNAHIEEF